MIKYLITIIILLLLFYFIYNKNLERFDNFKNNYNINIINLDKDINRLKEITKQLNKQNIKFDRFKAVNGKKLKNNDYLLKQYFDKNIKIKYNNAQKACALSHILIWNKILNLNYKYNIIFEDDVIIPPNFFEKLNIYIKQLPKNWDILLLGGNRIVGKKYSKNLIIPDYNKFGNFGLFAYIINKTSIKRILNETNNINQHIDNFIQKNLGSKNFKIFFCNPILVNHNYNFFSNNFNKFRKKETNRNNKISILN